MSVKKTISLDEAVIERIRKFADQNGITFSGAIAILINQALQQQNNFDTLKQLANMLEQYKKTGGEAPPQT